MEKFVKTSVFAFIVLWAQTKPLDIAIARTAKGMDGISSESLMKATIVCESESNNCTKEVVKNYASAGFKAIRIAIAWPNNQASLDRAEEIINYAIDNNMYALLNIRYDEICLEYLQMDSAECINKYKKIWAQVSERFKGYCGHLVFDSLGKSDTAKREFSNIIRTFGGNRPFIAR